MNILQTEREREREREREITKDPIVKESALTVNEQHLLEPS